MSIFNPVRSNFNLENQNVKYPLGAYLQKKESENNVILKLI